jgi:DNA-binding transcriptional ArsR family regulator
MGSAKASGSGDPFDALGDPNRRAIIELPVSGGRSVREIAERGSTMSGVPGSFLTCSRKR